MFLGHFGVGFGSKRFAPKTSLGTLFLAAQFIDLLWPVLLLVGFERVAIVPGITLVTPLDFAHYPWSHSLLAVVIWGLLFGCVYYLVRRYRAGAWVCGAAVISHWVLDLLLHRPDLPILPGGDYRAGFEARFTILGVEVRPTDGLALHHCINPIACMIQSLLHVTTCLHPCCINTLITPQTVRSIIPQHAIQAFRTGC